LTEAVRRQPYTVVLLDEIEKAHPDVFNILLQIAEDGRLTDSHGRVIDFKNTLIIMTSNLGARQIQGEARVSLLNKSTNTGEDAKAYERMKGDVMKELKKAFRPEFLNRLDEVIVFHELTREEILTIVDLLLAKVNKQLAHTELRLEASQEVKEYLVEEGYDKTMGARPLRRAIQRLIEDSLSDEILRGTFKANDVIVAEMDGKTITFRRKEMQISEQIEESLSLAPRDEDLSLPSLEKTLGIG